jgi:hypothetical protein
MDQIRPISSLPDRSVPAVEFRRLTPIEREEERDRRERQRRRKAADRPPDAPPEGSSGIDVRV